MPTLTVLMGVPGAGKSTWAAAQPEGHYTLLRAEALRHNKVMGAVAVHEAVLDLRKRAIAALQGEAHVLIDGCNVYQRERAHWLRIGIQAQATTTLVVLEADLTLVEAVGVSEERMSMYVREFERAKRGLDAEGWDHVIRVPKRAVRTNVMRSVGW